jgi:hypothetical protein
MKRETKALLGRAVDSLLLAIDHFNRPFDQGRHEASLVLIDRAIELLLKAALIHRGHKIREAPSENTFGFERCVNKCVSEAHPAILSADEATTARVLNGLRDAAQHYLVHVSEQELYLYLQAGVTLFSDILQSVFCQKLEDRMPERVLPVSTAPPADLEAVVRTGFDEVRRLVKPGTRKKLDAACRLRSLAVLENSLAGKSAQPTQRDMDRLLKLIQEGKDWQEIFPGVASLNVSTEGTGLNVTIRLTKTEGTPVRLVKEDSPDAKGATVVAVKRVDELSYYSLNLPKLADHLGITSPKTNALIKHLRVQEDLELFKEIVIGRCRFKRYSRKALDLLRKELSGVDMDEVWRVHRPRARKT